MPCVQGTGEHCGVGSEMGELTRHAHTVHINPTSPGPIAEDKVSMETVAKPFSLWERV